MKIPSFQNEPLLWLALNVILKPRITENSFPDETFYFFPGAGWRGRFGVENYLIPFLPDCSEGKTRDRLPNALENWVVEGGSSPIGQSVPDAATNSL